MTWEPRGEEQAELDAAFAEAERTVGTAFARAVQPFGVTPRAPQYGSNPNESISRWVEWWLDLADPYDSLSCELLLLEDPEGPFVSARVAVWRYLGHGFSDSDDLWHSGEHRVGTPGQAAMVLRASSEALARQLAELDLSQFFRTD